MMKKSMNIIFLTVCFCLCMSVACFARAGGGGSGGGGSSGGGAGHHSYNTADGNSTSNSIRTIIWDIGTLFIIGGGSLIFFYKVQKAHYKSKQLIKSYEKLEMNWDYKEMQTYIEDAYFKIQECWRRQDVDYAKDYLSESLQKSWKAKLAWMQMREEVEVQNHVQLLSARPVKVVNPEGTEHDEVWYLIHGKMQDYRIKKTTGEFLEGNRKPVAFYEYWRFIYFENHWVLDEIFQKEDINIDDLT